MQTDVRKTVEARISEWTGRRLSSDEAKALQSTLGTVANKEWLELLQEFPLVGTELVLTRTQDPTRRGVTAAVMGPKSLLDEALNAYPGKIAVKIGFLPFGTCLVGSGDPYFLSFESPWKMVRILHDACDARAGTIDPAGIQTILPLADVLAMARIT